MGRVDAWLRCTGRRMQKQASTDSCATFFSTRRLPVLEHLEGAFPRLVERVCLLKHSLTLQCGLQHKVQMRASQTCPTGTKAIRRRGRLSLKLTISSFHPCARRGNSQRAIAVVVVVVVVIVVDAEVASAEAEDEVVDGVVAAGGSSTRVSRCAKE